MNSQGIKSYDHTCFTATLLHFSKFSLSWPFLRIYFLKVCSLVLQEVYTLAKILRKNLLSLGAEPGHHPISAPMALTFSNLHLTQHPQPYFCRANPKRVMDATLLFFIGAVISTISLKENKKILWVCFLLYDM